MMFFMLICSNPVSCRPDISATDRPPEPEVIDDETEYGVEAILAHKLRRRTLFNEASHDSIRNRAISTNAA